ncbi:hypothetical protein ACO0LC_10280 [Undibacterium sp. JH2W]|uniref:hypothetical protein n=1 Tax=Undibacterium sp. JH2W TaxID=3413037 RepID=UPI003BF17A2E
MPAAICLARLLQRIERWQSGAYSGLKPVHWYRLIQVFATRMATSKTLIRAHRPYGSAVHRQPVLPVLNSRPHSKGGVAVNSKPVHTKTGQAEPVDTKAPLSDPRKVMKQALQDLQEGQQDTDLHGQRGVEAVVKPGTKARH